jgi:hypothetical protein
MQVKWRRFYAKFQKAQKGEKPNFFTFVVHVMPLVKFTTFAILTSFVGYSLCLCRACPTTDSA